MEYRTEPPKISREHKDWLAFKEVERQRLEYLERRLDKRNPPTKFYVRHDHFVRLFNEDFGLKGSKRLTRRKLQYYSSPEIDLMPYPVRRGRHTSHYLYPDDYERLSVIWNLREKFFFPTDLIRKILTETPEDYRTMIIHWDESPEDLLDTIMMLKAGFDHDDIDNYSASKNTLEGATQAFLYPGKHSEEELKKLMLEKLERHYSLLKEWFSSGKGVRFWSSLIEARRQHPDFTERLRKQDEKAEETA